EFEGAEIAVYVRNPRYILEAEAKIRELARNLRKRIVVRTDPDSRMRSDLVRNYLVGLLPKEAGVDPNDDIAFDEILGEARVYAENPQVIYSFDRHLRYKVLAETGWRLEIFRKPPLKSSILENIHKTVLGKMSSERRKALRDFGERIYRDTLIGTRYVRIIGLGGFGEVGRSSILLDTGESKVLLDAGMSPSGYGPDAFPYFDAPEFRLEDLDAVVISHAHLDHVGMLPVLYKYGFKGPVYVTPPTRDLMVLIFRDLMEIARREGREPPFTTKEINTILTRVITVDYNVVTDVAPDVKLTFTNAGHILGSSLVHLHIGQGLYNILYTGDLKYYRIKGDKSTRLFPPATTRFHRIEALIMEATYGATETQSREKAEEELIRIINKIAETKGKLLIPVMAVGRGQDMMVLINKALKEGRIPEVPVYVDGMIYEVTAVYTTYPELLAKPLRDVILEEGYNPFINDNTIYVKTQSERDEAMQSEGPAVILATSGMMNGGPVIEYFKYLAEDENNVLAFVSYQAPGTLGRRLIEGEREIPIQEDRRLKTIKVRMDVRRVEGFTGHATRDELRLFLRHLTPKPRNIILNHGEPNALLSMATSIKSSWQRLGYTTPPEVIVPENLESVKLYPRNTKFHIGLQFSP
nr:beta-CASP ribonuclease aCPSF1 [Desulfurococcales archaeon]